MNNGWVSVRRGIIDHLLEGKLTSNEYLALVQLILFADASTGGYNVNAPLLMYRCGYGFSHDTAGRILASLHDKGYIWYRGVRFTKKPQPYWVNRYQLTKGPMKGRWTCLSELFEKSTVSQQDVWDRALQATDQTKDQTSDQ